MRYPTLLFISALAIGCSDSNKEDTENQSRAQKIASMSETSGDIASGGVLYDKFYTANASLGFSPDSKDTPGVADGTGGPNGDGTLNDSEGNPILNDAGHDYRLKNFYGWDLRGSAGIYGPSYQNKSYVLSTNLIDGSLSREAVAALVVDGAPGAPAWGGVLDDADLADLVEFIVATNEHRITQPGDIWDLSETAPKNYTLVSGGNATAGHAIIAEAASCGSTACHGADGTTVLFDDNELSLGMFARTKTYEGWFKVMIGHPGSAMGPQVDLTAAATVQSQRLKDIFAALCDRSMYPVGSATGTDVADGDVRCGTSLQ